VEWGKKILAGNTRKLLVLVQRQWSTQLSLSFWDRLRWGEIYEGYHWLVKSADLSPPLRHTPISADYPLKVSLDRFDQSVFPLHNSTLGAGNPKKGNK